MIRQAISCDICGTEKRQTNHWFVAYEQAGELRVSGWTSRHRLRTDSKHLCGQTCLHKLVDEFMAKSIAVRAKQPANEIESEPLTESPSRIDASLTSAPAYVKPRSPQSDRRPQDDESEPSVRLLTPAAPIPPKPLLRPQHELVTMPARPQTEDLVPAPPDSPRFTSRSWRAEAWERERARELRAAGNHPDIAARRRSNA